MITLLTPGKQQKIPPQQDKPNEELWITTKNLKEATGWELKPQGLCKDEVCVPLGAKIQKQFKDGDLVHASGLWTHLERPVLHDSSSLTWMMGEAAEERGRQLESLQAPDFSLPDLNGKHHRLSDFRGKKVFLTTWASW